MYSLIWPEEIFHFNACGVLTQCEFLVYYTVWRSGTITMLRRHEGVILYPKWTVEFTAQCPQWKKLGLRALRILVEAVVTFFRVGHVLVVLCALWRSSHMGYQCFVRRWKGYCSMCLFRKFIRERSYRFVWTHPFETDYGNEYIKVHLMTFHGWLFSGLNGD